MRRKPAALTGVPTNKPPQSVVRRRPAAQVGDGVPTQQPAKCPRMLELLGQCEMEVARPQSETLGPGKANYVCQTTSILSELAQGVVDDLPELHHQQLRENLGALEHCGATVGSIFSGSDLAWWAFQAFLVAALGPYAVLALRPVMAVERVPWKRQYLWRSHTKLEHLFGDAEQLQDSTGFCYIEEAHVAWPHCTFLSLGSSCKDFSTLKDPRHGDASRAVLNSEGSSGSTIRYAMAYIANHRPVILLLENVTGLFKGFLKRNAVTWRMVEDVYSNLALLLDFLRSCGYCAPATTLNPSPRLPVNRRRAWLPCFAMPQVGDGVPTHDGLVQQATQLLQEVQAHISANISLDRVLMSVHTPEYEYWANKAVEGAAGSADKTGTAKWRRLHEKLFRKAGLEYPCAFSTKMLELAQRAGMTKREAEIVFYYDRVQPMTQTHVEEMLLDLSQNLHRCRANVKDAVPCITPSSRFWKRRQRWWLLAPETMRIQGLDPCLIPNLHEFSHRQTIDLMGNAFNAASYLTALAVAMSIVDLKSLRLNV